MLEIIYSAWTIIYSVFIALFLFGLTVFIHEFGHFIVARKNGLKILTFSIGFGKAIWQREKDGIVYKVGWIPFGGYVALPQLDPEGMERIQGGEPVTFPAVSPWKKIAVAVCGPVGNILFAVVLSWVIFLGSDQPILEETSAVVGLVDESSAAYEAGIRPGDTVIAVNGKPVKSWYDFMVESLLGETDRSVDLTLLAVNTTKTVQIDIDDVEQTGQIVKGVDQAIPCLIGTVNDDSPAARAGIQADDIIVQFNGTPIIGWFQFVEVVQESPQEEISVVVKRDGQSIPLFLTPEYSEEYDRIMIGVSLGSFRVRPLDQLKNDASMITRVLKGLVTPAESGKVAKNLQGPVGILGMLMMAIKAGLWTTLGLIRLINVNLALLNLLPIPVLDGGHILFALWEGITRRKVNAKVQAVLINLFAILLIGAMLLVTVNDIDRKLDFKKFFGNRASDQTEQVEQPAPVDTE